MLECATEPYNPHLLGQAADERGNDGGMETLRGRRGGRMMEWLLNIQQAVKSMQGVVGRLHYGGASVLHLFISSLFSILVPRLLSSVSSVPLVFFLSLFPDIFSSSRFLPFFSCPHFFCVHNIFPLRSFFFIFHVFLEYIDFILFNFQPLYLFLFFLSKFSLPPLSFTFLFFFNFLSLSRSSLQLLSFFLSFVLFLSFFLAAHWDVRPPM